MGKILKTIKKIRFYLGAAGVGIVILIIFLLKIFTVDPYSFLNKFKESGFNDVQKIEITSDNRIVKVLLTKDEISEFFEIMKETEIWEPNHPLHKQRFKIKIYYPNAIDIFECATEGCNANEVHMVYKGDNVFPSNFKNIKLFDWAKDNNIICGF